MQENIWREDLCRPDSGFRPPIYKHMACIGPIFMVMSTIAGLKLSFHPEGVLFRMAANCAQDIH